MFQKTNVEIFSDEIRSFIFIWEWESSSFKNESP